MQISLDTHSGAYRINSYQPGKLVINEQAYNRSIIISLAQLVIDWRPQTLAELNAQDFAPVLALNPEVILLGTGDQLVFPSPAILAACYAKNIGVEIMSTGAACRTFEVLAAENRRVVAALLA